jgi:hypothetical protein
MRERKFLKGIGAAARAESRDGSLGTDRGDLRFPEAWPAPPAKIPHLNRRAGVRTTEKHHQFPRRLQDGKGSALGSAISNPVKHVFPRNAAWAVSIYLIEPRIQLFALRPGQPDRFRCLSETVPKFFEKAQALFGVHVCNVHHWHELSMRQCVARATFRGAWHRLR